MPRFAANLSMMFTEVPFLDRFEAALLAVLMSVFVALIPILPVIGHATWHLYRRAVERVEVPVAA